MSSSLVTLFKLFFNVYPNHKKLFTKQVIPLTTVAEAFVTDRVFFSTIANYVKSVPSYFLDINRWVARDQIAEPWVS